LRPLTGSGTELNALNLQPIDGIVDREIRLGHIPGAVVLIGQQGKVIYRRAFGYRALEPRKVAMTNDSIFDLASLTKPIATATAVMQLVEVGKIDLDEPVTRYWPEFGANGKKEIRVRDLLTHRSGLRAGLNGSSSWSGYREALKQIQSDKPLAPAGELFLYSDINFMILGELVARISGVPFDVYCAEQIFAKLGMKDTRFRPRGAQRSRIAPTTSRNGELLQGDVHDPIAYRMGGVSGHAGVFSSAADLALFAEMLLNGGFSNGSQILTQASIKEMTSRQQAGNSGWWGLGWEIAPSFDLSRDELPPPNSFGHTGYTGTSIWIDPDSRSYAIILTNRVHPWGAGDVKLLRTDVLRIVRAVLLPSTSNHVTNAAWQRPVRNGVDELAAQGFTALAGLRVGLITNHSGVDSEGRRTVDLLFESKQVKLAALFSPEHGLNGNLDQKISSSSEPRTKLPVHSLYGDALRPTNDMLRGLDALLFDIQDAGARFYTYITTMAYAMEAAAKHGISFFVLDRPNPINAAAVQGPLLDADLKSFTGYFPLPIRHGMTVGELASLFNEEARIGVRLRVIKMANYQRAAWYDQSGLRWIGPSPNLRTLAAATLYPGVAMVEGANVSVGRGTDSPFELVGAPWITGKELAAYLNRRNIAGLSFVATTFTPASDRFRNQLCQGVRIIIQNRDILDSPNLGVELTSALYRLYASNFQLDDTREMIGARWVLQAIKEGTDPRSITGRWQPSLDEFLKLRAKYLLYP
jgi:uncharacterized protein YbbC (DUF1343 family)/CubicO group peptidase (beta-lactamase class C family)